MKLQNHRLLQLSLVPLLGSARQGGEVGPQRGEGSGLYSLPAMLEARPMAGGSARKGFTLIELLVVIAIISLLAAILFPVFGRAREMGRRTSCASNLKQLSLSVFQYAQDYDERFPAARIDAPSVDTSWRYVVQPYQKSVQINFCPSHPRNQTVTGGSGLIFPISYAGNHCRGSGTGAGIEFSFNNGYGAFSSDDTGLLMSQFPFPATTIQIIENVSTTQHVVDITAGGACGAYPSSTTNGDCLWSGHLGTANYAFADGHVKALRPSQTFDASMNMWYRTNALPTDNIPWTGGNALTNMKANLNAVELRYQ